MGWQSRLTSYERKIYNLGVDPYTLIGGPSTTPPFRR